MIAMHTFGAGPYMSSMLRALFAARGWILGIQILVLISCLNGFVQTGDAFSALTCLAAVALFSLFAGPISSAVYGLAASLCFAMVLLAPLHHYMRLTAQTVLAMTAFLASAMAAYVTGVTLNVDGGTWAASGWTKGKDGKWQLFAKDFDV